MRWRNGAAVDPVVISVARPMRTYNRVGENSQSEIGTSCWRQRLLRSQSK